MGALSANADEALFDTSKNWKSIQQTSAFHYKVEYTD